MIRREEALNGNMQMRPTVPKKTGREPQPDDPDRKVERRIAWRRIGHTASYRFSKSLSLSFALLACTTANGCAPVPAGIPANVIVSERIPAGWPTPRIEPADASPALQVMRFSSLDVAFGSTGTDWDGEF